MHDVIMSISYIRVPTHTHTPHVHTHTHDYYARRTHQADRLLSLLAEGKSKNNNNTLPAAAATAATEATATPETIERRIFIPYHCNIIVIIIMYTHSGVITVIRQRSPARGLVGSEGRPWFLLFFLFFSLLHTTRRIRIDIRRAGGREAIGITRAHGDACIRLYIFQFFVAFIIITLFLYRYGRFSRNPRGNFNATVILIANRSHRATRT